MKKRILKTLIYSAIIFILVFLAPGPLPGLQNPNIDACFFTAFAVGFGFYFGYGEGKNDK